MKRLFKRIWDDVKRGENIDFYLTVFVSFGLVFLGLVGVQLQGIIAPITLAVLGLLAVSTLRNRYLMEELGAKLATSSGSVLLEEFPPSIATDIEKASEIWLTGVALRVLDNYYFQFEKALRNGCGMKVLLVNPSGSAIEMVASRSYVQGQTNRIERASNNTRKSLDDFCQLRSITNGKMEIRTIEFSLGHRLVATNPDSVSGVLYIANYPFRTHGGSKPKFVIQAKDGKWYDFYKEEFNLLWNSGIEWQCSDG